MSDHPDPRLYHDLADIAGRLQAEELRLDKLSWCQQDPDTARRLAFAVAQLDALSHVMFNAVNGIHWHAPHVSADASVCCEWHDVTKRAAEQVAQPEPVRPMGVL